MLCMQDLYKKIISYTLIITKSTYNVSPDLLNQKDWKKKTHQKLHAKGNALANILYKQLIPTYIQTEFQKFWKKKCIWIK